MISMAKYISNLKIKQQFKFLLVTLAAGFIFVGISSSLVLYKLKVNGPIYQQIVQGKDLVADILPPPEYIIETHLVVHQLRFAKTDSEKTELIKSLKSLESDFDSRHDYWKSQNLDQSLQKPFIDDAYGSGKAYYKMVESDFIPAVQAGNVAKMDSLLAELGTLYQTHRKSIDETVKIANDLGTQSEQEAARIDTFATVFLIVVFVVVALIALYIARSISGNLVSNLGGEPAELHDAARRIAEGELDFSLPLAAGDRASVMAQMDEMKTKLKVGEVKAKESLRVKVALDNVSMGVRVADNDGTVIYVNNSLLEILRRDEKAFQKENPAFVADKVVGGSIGVFYANPDAAIERLRHLNSTTKTRLQLGGRQYDVVTTPVISVSGERLGTVGQWVDQTEHIKAESEVEKIVSAAANGDFSQRISLEGKEGFFLQLGEGMNRLVETSATSLEEVVRVLGALSKGDLTETITSEYHGTFGQLKEDANSTVEKLTEVIQRIKEAGDTINTAAKEIASGNTDLSQRTEQQASNLEETAASMEELTSTVKQNAESAKQANHLANGASDIAMKGGEVVGKVVETMSSISESSKKIVDIISVIDGIAFQTNILALNAAVEAARAGEQGRGFAVVASEVRNLAQRSAAAAKEIKTLINNSVDKVKVGTDLADKAGKTMDEVVSSVRHVTDIMAEISAASIEQSSGIEQVNQAITQMDDVTQQNAALVEEAAAAAESLEEQAQQLSGLISTFRLSGDRVAPTAERGAQRALPKPPARLATVTPQRNAAKSPPKVSNTDAEEWKEF